MAQRGPARTPCACEPASVGPTTRKSYHRGLRGRPPAPMTETIITSRRHPLVARCRDAADGHTDDVLLDGPHLVADAIDAGVALPVIVVAEGAEARPDIAAIVARAERQGRLVQRVTPAVLDAASPTRTPVGILALATLALRDVSQFAVTPRTLLTVAVGIQDPGQRRDADSQQRSRRRHRLRRHWRHGPSVRVEGVARCDGEFAPPARRAHRRRRARPAHAPRASASASLRSPPTATSTSTRPISTGRSPSAPEPKAVACPTT